jgi:hypothetical protein
MSRNVTETGKGKVIDKSQFGKMYFEVVAIQLARTNPSRDKMIELSLCAWNERGERFCSPSTWRTHT